MPFKILPLIYVLALMQEGDQNLMHNECREYG